MQLRCADRHLDLSAPAVMGVLNVTPDSFSDGGRYASTSSAVDRAAQMLADGARIIDVGGESTRPGAKPLWEGDEIKRVVPAIEACAGMGAAVSVDTRKAAVMEAALEAGAHLVNDVSGLAYDPRSAEVVAQAGCPVVLMHAPGADGDDLHHGGEYFNVVFDVFDALRERRDAALSAGVEARNILLDPGIGFGKSLADNLALMNALPLFHALGHPVLLGVSRKRMIGALSNEAEAGDRLGGSVALAGGGSTRRQQSSEHSSGRTITAKRDGTRGAAGGNLPAPLLTRARGAAGRNLPAPLHFFIHSTASTCTIVRMILKYKIRLHLCNTLSG